MRRRRRASARCEGRRFKLRLCPPFFPCSPGSRTSLQCPSESTIVELERVTRRGAGVAEGSELGQGNEVIVVGVELVHDAAELVLVGEGGAEGAKDGTELPI